MRREPKCSLLKPSPIPNSGKLLFLFVFSATGTFSATSDLLTARYGHTATLLLNGDRDLSTPLEWARQEAALAPQGKLVVVPGASHSIQTRERGDAGRRALQEFLLG